MRTCLKISMALVIIFATVVGIQPAASVASNGEEQALAETFSSIAHSVSDSGLAVGYSRVLPATEHAVLWTETGQIVDLGGANGDFSRALHTNNAGQVVGYGRMESGETHALRWTKAGAMTDLGTLGGDWSRAYGINNLGQVVGESHTVHDRVHAVMWLQDGTPVDLGALNDDFSAAYDLNDHGDAVGYGLTKAGTFHALWWTTFGPIIDLGTLGGANSYARAINQEGTIVGYSETAIGETHAFRWRPTEGMVDLSVADTGTGRASYAYAINNRGEIAGYAETRTGDARAFLWNQARGMTQIGTLGGAWSYGHGLNESGQLVGCSPTFWGDIHAFRWTATEGIVDLGALDGDWYIFDRTYVPGPGGSPPPSLAAGRQDAGVPRKLRKSYLIKIGSSSMKKNNVLIPVNGVDFSLKILPMVQRFLKPTENHLILLHVAKEPKELHIHRPGMEDLDIFVDQAEEGLRINFADELHLIVRSLQEAGFEVTTEVQFGQPAQVIETFLTQQPVDMVAMVTHGRTGLDRIVHGSVAEHLLHHNSVPLLLYHPTPEAQE